MCQYDKSSHEGCRSQNLSKCSSTLKLHCYWVCSLAFDLTIRSDQISRRTSRWIIDLGWPPNHIDLSPCQVHIFAFRLLHICSNLKANQRREYIRNYRDLIQSTDTCAPDRKSDLFYYFCNVYSFKRWSTYFVWTFLN